jgi:hypothetical protein
MNKKLLVGLALVLVTVLVMLMSKSQKPTPVMENYDASESMSAQEYSEKDVATDTAVDQTIGSEIEDLDAVLKDTDGDDFSTSQLSKTELGM